MTRKLFHITAVPSVEDALTVQLSSCSPLLASGRLCKFMHCLASNTTTSYITGEPLRHLYSSSSVSILTSSRNYSFF